MQLVLLVGIHRHSDVEIESEELLQKELRDISCVSEWKKFGIHLGLPAKHSKEVEGRSALECWTEMLRKWWNYEPNANWKQVIKALQKMGENRRAKELELKYLAHLISVEKNNFPGAREGI